MLIGKLIRFLKLPISTKYILAEAAIYSARYRWQILHMPFKKIAPSIGTFKYETDPISYKDPGIKYKDPCIKYKDSGIKTIGWAVETMTRYVPWKSQCLDRALAAKKILNKRGYPCTLYMGVIQNQEKKLTAHAWLRCGNIWVTGGNGQEAGYAVTGIYGDEEGRQKNKG